MSRQAPDLTPLLQWHFARLDERRCPRENELARFAARDLTPKERSEFEAHLKDCLECRIDLQAFEMDVREHRLEDPKRHPWLEGRLGVRPLRWATLGVALAAVALVVLVRLPEVDMLRPKGRQPFQLHVAVSREGQVSRWHEGQKLAPGDQLGFFYTAEKDGYLMILYASEKETVRIFPASDAKSARVARGSEIRLPDGATYRPGQGCEWIVGLFSARPLGDSEAADLVKDMATRREACKMGGSPASDVKTQVIEVNR